MWAGANAIFRKIRFESSPLGPDRRAIQAATANILLAFAAGPAGRRHPARELIPPTGRPPLLGTS